MQDYLDTDSDNDCIPDRIEAGDSDIDTDPVDSDSDGIPDFRDTDEGDDVPDLCSNPAGQSLLAEALNTLVVKPIGIDIYEWSGSYTDDVIQQDIIDLAEGTGSYWDSDGEGVMDDPIIMVNPMIWPSTEILRDMLDSLETEQPFDISTSVQEDPCGFLYNITPDEFVEIVSGYPISFTVALFGMVYPEREDTICHVTIGILMDGAYLLDTITIYILVPGYP